MKSAIRRGLIREPLFFAVRVAIKVQQQQQYNMYARSIRSLEPRNLSGIILLPFLSVLDLTFKIKSKEIKVPVPVLIDLDLEYALFFNKK